MTEVFPEQIAHVLKKSILKGIFRPGFPLDAEALAKEFGTSRSVVCEGLRQLQESGLVLYDGCQPMVGDLNEVFDIRLLLEPEALRLAIPNHTQTLWDKLEQLQREIESLPNTELFVQLSWQWHRLLYASANRPRLLCMIEKLHQQIGDNCELVIGFREHSQDEHASILNACKARDVDLACKLLVEHIDHHRHILLENLSK